jgi:hypothetical protein
MKPLSYRDNAISNSKPMRLGGWVNIRQQP